MIRALKFYSEKAGVYDILRSTYLYFNSRLLRKLHKKMVENDFILPKPKNIVIEPTLRCNLRCKMCYLDFDKLKFMKELTLDEISALLDSAPSVRQITLIGGEIFLRKDLFEMIGLFEKKGISVLLSTNGTLVNSEICGKLRKFRNIIGINISIDGTREIHNKVRGVPYAFDRAVQSIILLKKYFPVSVTCVIQKLNLPALPEVIKTAKAIGIKSIILEYERKYSAEELVLSAELMNFAVSDFALSVSKNAKADYTFEELQSAVSKAETQAKESGIKIYYFPFYFREKMKECYEKKLRGNNPYICKNIFEARIDPEGNVFHCFAFRKKIGSIKEESFSRIWNSDEYRCFRKKLISNNLLPICETCWHMRRI